MTSMGSLEEEEPHHHPLKINPSQHQFIVNFVGEGQALIGEGVPLWGAGSKNLIFLLTHTRPHYLLTLTSPSPI